MSEVMQENDKIKEQQNEMNAKLDLIFQQEEKRKQEVVQEIRNETKSEIEKITSL